MSASVLAIPVIPASSREWMVTVLDATVLGLTPPLLCSACLDALADRCEACAEAEARIKVITAAIGAVESARTRWGARRAYKACLLGLAKTGGGR